MTPKIRLSPQTIAALQALFVAFLWSTSWVLIKFGLRDQLPALTFAGLRYTVASLCFLPTLWLHRESFGALRGISKRDWLAILALAVLFYTVTQGAQYVGLRHLPAMTVNLLISLSAIVVAGLAILFLGEKPTRLQWAGVGLYLAGALIFFYPIDLPAGTLGAIGVVLGGVLANALSALLGRSINQRRILQPIVLTAITMSLGATLLLSLGLATEGIPHVSLSSWAIILWLALVNTAFAFTLWNLSLRTLSALESSIINNTMMIHIPILAWLFLGEAITPKSGLGLLLAGIGTLAVQLRKLPIRLRETANQPKIIPLEE